MLGTEYFYNASFKKYIALFGTLFNEIHVKRTDADGKFVDDIIVPLTYAPKDKMMSRLASDPELDRPSAIVLPRMSFEMVHPWYDANRQLGVTNQIYAKDPDNADKIRALTNPSAWSLDFKLYIYIKDTEDGVKIVEQILPFFRPSLTVTANLMGDLDTGRDIPITLNDVTTDDQFAGPQKDRRVHIWELSFTMNAWLYGPVCHKPIIKFVDLNGLIPDGPFCQYIHSGNTFVITTLRTQPGLTVDGKPTSDVNNSINVHSIFMDDDWGVVQILTDNTISVGNTSGNT